MSSPGAALEPHPYSYPYEAGGVSCATCGGHPAAALHDPSRLTADDYPAELEPQPARRRYYSGPSLRELVTLATWLAALAAGVMGDIWLSGHL